MLLLRQLIRHRLIENGTRRGRDNQQRAGISGGLSALRLGTLSRVFGSVQRGGGKYLVQGQAPRLGLHDHARATAVRGVIHRAVTVKGVIAQVVQVQVHQALLARLTQQGQLQRLQVLGENRDHIVAHGLLPRLLGRMLGHLRRILLSVLDQVNQTRRRSQQHKAGLILGRGNHFGHNLLNKRNHDLFTRTGCKARRTSQLNQQQILNRHGLQTGHLAQRLANSRVIHGALTLGHVSEQVHGQVHELLLVEALFIALILGHLVDQAATAQLLSLVAGGHLIKTDHQNLLVPAGTGNRQLTGRRHRSGSRTGLKILDTEHLTAGKTLLRGISKELNRHLTTNTVRLTDTSHHNLHNFPPLDTS
ncbi:phox homology domain protein [Rothia mucilaginosa DY-18]|uniref:Phox homology domain protein n=1 Tax=Rothia mucilaginosa (strain DY-18) TaxID=680646 RepID=D2NSP9_ROTMD|nr:phox homology domain protein [Rothia mucilaginosa DY-18]